MMVRPERKARAVTIIDIAKSAGVLKSTVSLVLKKSPLVKEETRQQVTKTMNTLGYVYNRGAASLRRSRADLVGMVINDLSNPFFAELAIGIERALQNSGFIPFIASTAEGVVRRAATICTHLRRRPLRRVPFSESMMPRNVWGQKMEGSLGRFGDRRLEKGGSACWPVWLVSDNPASVCVAWVAIERARCGLRASCVIRV